MPDPLYRQIAEKLQRMIESGVLPPGAKLPTEPELTRVYKASRNTIRQAVRWLTNRGLVQTRLGQGTYVVQRARPTGRKCALRAATRSRLPRGWRSGRRRA